MFDSLRWLVRWAATDFKSVALSGSRRLGGGSKRRAKCCVGDTVGLKTIRCRRILRLIRGGYARRMKLDASKDMQGHAKEVARPVRRMIRKRDRGKETRPKDWVQVEVLSRMGSELKFWIRKSFRASFYNLVTNTLPPPTSINPPMLRIGRVAPRFQKANKNLDECGSKIPRKGGGYKLPARSGSKILDRRESGTCWLIASKSEPIWSNWKMTDHQSQITKFKFEFVNLNESINLIIRRGISRYSVWKENFQLRLECIKAQISCHFLSLWWVL